TAEVLVTTPTYLVAKEAIVVRNGSLSYQYKQPALAQTITALETSGTGTDLFGSDVATVTIVASGIDETGEPAIRTRTVTIFHDRMISFESQTAPATTGGDE